jgi:hypothetical protein
MCQQSIVITESGCGGGSVSAINVTRSCRGLGVKHPDHRLVNCPLTAGNYGAPAIVIVSRRGSRNHVAAEQSDPLHLSREVAASNSTIELCN